MAIVPTNDGRWVDENFARLAEVIQDYDPAFDLRWIPPEHRSTPDDVHNCYAVVETNANGEFVVFHAGPLATPEEILTRLFQGDNTKGNALERMEARNAAQEALRLKEQIELSEERKEYVEWLIGTQKNYIQLGGGRIADDQLRIVSNDRR